MYLVEYNNSEVKGVVNNIPKVGKDKFKSLLKPGDIILSKPKSTSLYKKIKTVLLIKAQHGIITSSKLYIGNNQLIGYDLGSKNSRGKVGLYNFDSFYNTHDKIILIRPNDFDNKKRRKIIRFMIRKKGVSYDSSSLFKTAWNRWIIKTFSNKDIVESLDDDILENLKAKFFCSNLISIGLKYAGWDKGWNVEIAEVWPIDILMNENMKKLAIIDKGV
jgi:hypothetical protein